MGTEHNPKGTECYYYVRGYCHCREEGSMYCTQKGGMHQGEEGGAAESPKGSALQRGKGAACDHFKRDMQQEQWKEKYWSLMRMLREKVQK